MRKLIAILSVVALIVTAGCKDKPKKEVRKPVKKAIVQKPVKKDTTAIDSLKKVVVKQEVKEIVAPKPDKYFLIAGSFSQRQNAEVFQAKLEKDGFSSEVIERPGGPNGEFYKVSYKGFYDKKDALAELRHVRNVEGRTDVWLLVKK